MNLTVTQAIETMQIKLTRQQVTDAVRDYLWKMKNGPRFVSGSLRLHHDGTASAVELCPNTDGPDYGFFHSVAATCALSKGHEGDHRMYAGAGIDHDITWANHG